MSEIIEKSEILTGDEEQILKLFGRVIPNMSPTEKARLLGIGEGLAIRQDQFPIHDMDAG